MPEEQLSFVEIRLLEEASRATGETLLLLPTFPYYYVATKLKEKGLLIKLSNLHGARYIGWKLTREGQEVLKREAVKEMLFKEQQKG